MAGRMRAAGCGLALLLAMGCQSLGPKTPTRLPPPKSALPGMPAGQAAREPELRPAESAKACLAAARDLDRTGHPAQALPLYERARGFDPKLEAECAHRMGALHTQLGDFARAEAEFRRAAAKKPNDPELHCDFGYLLYQQRRLPEAEQSYRAALALAPRHPRSWTNLGLLYGSAGRFDESLQAFRQTHGEAEARCSVALLQAKAGQRDDAVAALRQLSKERPDLKVAKDALAALVPPAGKADPQVLPASFTARE